MAGIEVDVHKRRRSFLFVCQHRECTLILARRRHDKGVHEWQEAVLVVSACLAGIAGLGQKEVREEAAAARHITCEFSGEDMCVEILTCILLVAAFAVAAVRKDDDGHVSMRHKALDGARVSVEHSSAVGPR